MSSVKYFLMYPLTKYEHNHIFKTEGSGALFFYLTVSQVKALGVMGEYGGDSILVSGGLSVRSSGDRRVCVE